MKTSAEQLSENGVVRYTTPAKQLKCLSCGTDRIKPGRRYCSRQCRQQINWVLSLSKGLLRTFNARYAAFSFTRNHVILDVLPVWSKVISRFICKRTFGNKPAEDLKNLILQAGREWYQMVDNNTSKSFASLSLLEKNHKESINPKNIKPDRKASLRLTKHEKESLKILELDRKDLSSDEHVVKIKASYKRMAKLHHPDMGGDTEKFKQLNEAHKQMLLWTENPQYASRRALQDCWSYDGVTSRWSPPL